VLQLLGLQLWLQYGRVHFRKYVDHIEGPFRDIFFYQV